MKRTLLIALVLLLTAFVVACGGNTAKGNTPNTPTNGEKSEGHDHGKMEDIGKKKIGDRDVTVMINDWEPGKEAVAQVSISGDGQEKLKVTAWIEADGKEVTPKVAGEWTPAEKKFDCHLEIRKDVEPGKVKLWIQIGDGKDSWDAEINAD